MASTSTSRGTCEYKQGLIVDHFAYCRVPGPSLSLPSKSGTFISFVTFESRGNTSQHQGLYTLRLIVTRFTDTSGSRRWTLWHFHYYLSSKKYLDSLTRSSPHLYYVSHRHCNNGNVNDFKRCTTFTPLLGWTWTCQRNAKTSELSEGEPNDQPDEWDEEEELIGSTPTRKSEEPTKRG